MFCRTTRISRSCCPVAPMLILVETRKTQNVALRYPANPIPYRPRPSLPFPSPCTFPCHPVLLYVSLSLLPFPSHACPCTENCPLSCTYHSGMVRDGTCSLYCWPHTNACIFPCHPHTPPSHQPVVSSLRRSSQSLSATNLQRSVS